MGKIIKKRIEYGGSSNSAENIKYDDTKNVKEAINEVNSNLEKASQTKRLSNVSVLSVVKNGKYYVGGAMDIPSGSSSFGYLDVHVYDDNDTNRKITWTPVNSNVTYTNIKEGDTWLGWDSYAKNSDLSKKVDYIDFIDITEDTNFNSLSLLMAQKSYCSIWLCNNNAVDSTVPNGLFAVFQYSAGTSYIAQMMMSYFGDIKFRSRSTDVWSEWKNLV